MFILIKMYLVLVFREEIYIVDKFWLEVFLIFLILNSYMRSMSIVVVVKKDGDNWKIMNDFGLILVMVLLLYDDIVLFC